MKQTTTTLAPQRRPGLQTLKSALLRLTMTLMLVMLTAMTAWAQEVDLGNCWHVPAAAEPTGTYMRNPIHPYASLDVTIYNGNQAYEYEGGNPGNPGDQSGGTIYYRAAGASAWQTVPMDYDTEIENNKYWRGTIPADEFAEGTPVEYIIKVTYNEHDDTYLGLAAEGETASTAFGTMAEAEAHPFSFKYLTPNTVDYIDENGQTQTVTATVLTTDLLNSDLGIDGATTWYVVNEDITHSGKITCRGNVNLILADGKTMTTSNTGTYAIYGDNGTLTIYGQTNGTGTLEAICSGDKCIDHQGNVAICGGTVNATSSNDAISARGSVTISGGTVNTNGNIGINGSSGVTINGGTVTATATMLGIGGGSGSITITGGTVNATGQTGIRGNGGVTINGGQVTATATNGGQGIISYGDIILGWTNATDYIKASSYQVNGSGTVNIADGQAFLTDDATPVQIKGTLSSDDKTAIAGKTLTPDLSYAPDITVSYVKADGTTDTHQATVLTGGGATTLDAGWYVVISNINYTGTVSLAGDATLILADGKTMTLSSDGDGIRGNNGCTLTIYGQTLGTGTLSATATSEGKTISHNGNVAICGGTVIVNGQWGISAIGTVTINGGTLSATSSTGGYAVYSATGIIINGGQVEATSTYNAICGDLTMTGGNVTANGLWGIIGNLTMTGGNLTATGNDTGIKGNTTLGWTNASDRFTASSYTGAGTVTIADGQVFTDGSGHYYSGTLSSDDKTAIAGETLAPAVPYVDADGQTDYCTNFTVLTGSETMLAPGWYVVNSDITYDHNLELSDEGTVNIILADGKTMTINVGPYDNPGISDIAGEKNLTIYGQTAQDGTLRITAVNGGIYCGTLTINSGTVNVSSSTSSIYATWVIINGGVVTATANGKDVNNPYGANLLFYSIFSSEGVSINGGQVTATGNSGRIASGNSSDITLGYTKATDFISFKKIDAAGEVKIANDKSMTDGTNIYNSSTSSETLEALTNVTLTPYGMTLAAKEATVDGQTDYWTTYYCGDAGLAIDDAENACAYTATVSGETITLHRLGKVIPAGTAVIIVGEDESIGMTVSTAPAEQSPDNDLHGVDVATPLATVKSTYSADAILMLSNKNGNFGFHDVALTNIPARKAFLAIDDPDPSKARQFTMVFDGETGIRSLTPDPSPSGEGSDYWYTLDGRRIANGQKPTAKGLYIYKGKKVVIK